jgi:hypothetical protein
MVWRYYLPLADHWRAYDNTVNPLEGWPMISQNPDSQRGVPTTEEITAAIQRGMQHAALEHARAGRSVPAWRDGKVVMLPPDEIMAQIAALERSKEAQSES